MSTCGTAEFENVGASIAINSSKEVNFSQVWATKQLYLRYSFESKYNVPLGVLLIFRIKTVISLWLRIYNIIARVKFSPDNVMINNKHLAIYLNV